MKKKLSLNFLIIACIIVSAQVNYRDKYKNKFHLQNLSKQTLKYFDDAQNCWENTEDSCIPFYKKMLGSARKNSECIPCAEIELARGYYFELLYDSSKIHLQNVLKGSKKLENRLKLELEQDAYNLLGANYGSAGDIKSAIKYMLESAKRIDQLGHKDKAALIKVNLGVLYSKMDNYEKAIQYEKDAFDELIKLSIKPQTAIVANNIASFYINLGKSDSALIWSTRALRLAKEQNDTQSQIAANYLKASAFEKSNSDSALIYADKAIDLALKHPNNKFLASAYNVKGNVLSEKNNYPEAKKNFLKSIELYKSLDNHPDAEAPIKMLGSEAYKYKDYETAARYLSEYVELKDSLVSEENRQLVHELNTQYETEKKEKQIAEQELKIQRQRSNLLYAILGGGILLSILGGVYIYNRKSQKLKLKQLQQEKENAILNSFIQGEERERSRISHELHDSVAAMIGAAKMSLETIPHLIPEKQSEHLSKVISILENTHADVRHIAHNLLPTVLEKEGIIKATQHFASEINETKLLNVSVVNDNSGAEELTHQLQLMLFRVIQELVNNIIKHSQAQNAVISFTKNSEGLQVIVSDDGIGFEGEVGSENHGLYSISQRLKSIGGNFKLIKNKDAGMNAIAELKL